MIKPEVIYGQTVFIRLRTAYQASSLTDIWPPKTISRKNLKKMHLAILTLTFRLHGCSSLKEKRHRISSIKEKFSRVTSVAGCESHYQDSWQMCEFSFVAVSTTRKAVESNLTTIVNYAEKEMDAELLDHKMEWI